ncbi:DUF5994 family protein [Streptomyces sp. NPDC088253]|uniref:DUF5994 family protein n=1 Tax=Streptomyces sp. NPDC088253 TaxID=3365846 RepID=UPI00382743F0
MTLAPPPALSSSSAVRLRLVAQPAQGHMPRRIDGAWWPRSPDLTSELPWLLGGLPQAWGQVSSVLVDGAVWSPFPVRLLVADQVVRLRRTNTQHTPSTVCLLTPGRGRWDLLVVPPTATEAEAEWLMDSMDTAVKDGVGLSTVSTGGPVGQGEEARAVRSAGRSDGGEASAGGHTRAGDEAGVW